VRPDQQSSRAADTLSPSPSNESVSHRCAQGRTGAIHSAPPTLDASPTSFDVVSLLECVGVLNIANRTFRRCDARVNGCAERKQVIVVTMRRAIIVRRCK